VFHVERLKCKSKLFVETVDVEFYQGKEGEEPPIDYFHYVYEDIMAGHIVAEIQLADVFSSGPPYDVHILSGRPRGEGVREPGGCKPGGCPGGECEPGEGASPVQVRHCIPRSLLIMHIAIVAYTTSQLGVGCGR
jgi:hypothetical protein